MDLLVSTDDYCVKKIEIAAAFANIKLIKKNVSEQELIKCDSKAKSMVLSTPSGTITQHLTMLRYFSGISSLCPLGGMNSIESATVDQWLEFCW